MQNFGYDKAMQYLVSLILFFMLCYPVYGEDLNGKAYFQQGRNEFNSGRYEDAIVSLTRAVKEFPVLGDYALLWLSDAYHETGNHKESLETIRTLLKQYPHSPLVKKSRTREIKEAQEVPEENIQTLYECYVKDYPSDAEMKYLYAQWLKHNGQSDKARLFFKEIYIDARAFSMMAFQELDAAAVSVGEMLKHASNHIKLVNYKTAESVLRSALAKDDGRFKNEILRELGLSLFKQKKYREASDIYKQAGERYWEIRSLYRAGEKATLNDSLDQLLGSSDKRMSSVLISLAADRRRDGKSQDALTLYQAVMEKFPSEAEESLWGMGWTYFLTGEYQKASEIFSRLHSTYSDPKYLYWKTRSLESSGEAPLMDSHKTSGRAPDFYSIMLNVRAASRPQQSQNREREGFIRPVALVQSTAYSYGEIERVELLFNLGFAKEGLSEMIHISKNCNSIDDLFYLCAKFQELGEYKFSVRLAGKIPNTTDAVHHFLYPIAYQNTIETLSAKYSLDPFLTLSIVREESRFDYEAKSSAGAIGLMQLMPGTAFRIDRELSLGVQTSRDLTDVQKNLHIGIYYLSHLVREFGAYPQAIAAYNAGEETVRKWIRTGNYKSADEFIEDIPYSETRNYVKRVLTTFYEYKRSYAKEPQSVNMNLEKM